LGAAGVAVAAIGIGGYGPAGFLAPYIANLSDQEFKRYRRLGTFDRVKANKFTLEPQPQPLKLFGKDGKRICGVCYRREIR
jgi:hypothetical protein